MNTQNASSITVSGETKLLDNFQQAKLKSKNSISITGDAGLKIIGAKGAFLIDVIKLRRFFGGYKYATDTGELPMAIYDNLDPKFFE